MASLLLTDSQRDAVFNEIVETANDVVLPRFQNLGDGEIDTRWDHQGHPVADLHTARAEEALGGALHHVVELAERDRAAVGTHLSDRNPIGDRRVPQRRAQIDRRRRWP